MTRRYRVVHETEYHYDWPAGGAWQLAHLKPRQTPRQTLISHHLEIEPLPSEWGAGVDYFGNPVQRFAVPGNHDRLTVRSLAEVEVGEVAIPGTRQSWGDLVGALAVADPALRFEVVPFVLASPFVPLLEPAEALARGCFTPGADARRALEALAARIREAFVFDPDATHVGTPLAEVLQTRRGVCQDFAHLMISGLRAIGMPARYVSGYLLTEPPPGQPRLQGADASHAWVSAWCGEAGWVDVDPTNGRLADHSFITLGWGRDYGDVAPLRGVVRGGGRQRLEVRVTVTPV